MSLKTTIWLVVLVSILFAVGCQRPEQASATQKYEQGIIGKVTWEAGNMMPGPDSKRAEARPIVRDVLIYELTTMNQGKQTNGLYHSLETKMIAQVKSDENGSYRVALPEGSYSVFVKEEDGLFANSFNGKGQVNAVKVVAGEFATLNIKVNYQAAY